MSTNTQHQKIRARTEGAMMVALAQVLSYLKLYEFPQGGAAVSALSVGCIQLPEDDISFAICVYYNRFVPLVK